jgi:hypothetical protein
MKRLLLLLFLAIPGFCQCSLTTFVAGTTIQPGPVNANFTSLNTCKTNRYSGSAVPGLISSSRLGDLYTRTGTTEAYMCFAAGPCTAVASGNWVLLGTGGTGGGTVTVNLSGVLANTAVVTGAGFQKIQTPNSFTRIDAGGNFSTPGFIETGVGTSDAGSIFLNRTTVSGLPTCQSDTEGTRMSVNDATATTFYSTVVGGGSNHVPVYCNGTVWVIG